MLMSPRIFRTPAALPAGKRGKTKYVSLSGPEGVDPSRATLAGRRLCDCQSAKHGLINNCLRCGRIVCEQEGSGPCLFCGALVCTKREQEQLERGSKKSDQLMKKLLSRAEDHKNKLLEFDAAHEKRTQVIDDESDYFSVDSDKWLSKEQREALRKREAELREERHGSRLNKKINFDFAGRKIVEAESGLANYDPAKDEALKKIMEMGSAERKEPGKAAMVSEGGDVVNPTLNGPRPTVVRVYVGLSVQCESFT